jgi:hypothetical protein
MHHARLLKSARTGMTTGSIDILGIETSCDETAAAVVRRFADGTGEILADVVLSQLDLHSAFGGVVPELAARSHVSTLDRLVEQALEESGVPLTGIDAVAVTSGPGLIGGLMVGLMTAKAIAMAASKPLSRHQPSRGPCADRPSDRQCRLSLPVASGVGRPHPDRAGQGRQ